VLGKTRAKQFYSDDADRTHSAAVLLHGDGAFSGQGIVYETLDLCGLFDYTVGGTIHLVVNNQVRVLVRLFSGRGAWKPWNQDE
jgi:2-oxoglutarate dehydrogenase E1 component